MKRKKYIIFGGALLLMLVTWLALGDDPGEQTIIYATPQKGFFEVTITSSGELRAKNSVRITAPENMREIRVFSATIERLVPEGTVVEKGDFVAELDRSEVLSALKDAQLNLKEERTELEQARLDCTLTLSQARDNLINLKYAVEESKIVMEQSIYEAPATQRQYQIDYEQAKRQLQQAKKNYKIQVKQAEATIRRSKTDIQKEKNDLAKIKSIMKQFDIYAPERGMVIYVRNRDGTKVTEGSSISAWNPVVAELPDFSVMESVTYINEVDIQKIKEGQKVDISLDAMPDKHLSGVITDVANIGEQLPNSTSKVFEVVIRVNESDSTLRPAMTTSNVIHISSLNNALYVPLETVHAQDSISVVYKREGGGAVMQQVILGMMNKNNVVIKEGVNIEDQLYFSMPQDTANIEKRYLPEEVLRKYSPEEITTEEETTPKSTQPEMPPDTLKRLKTDPEFEPQPVDSTL